MGKKKFIFGFLSGIVFTILALIAVFFFFKQSSEKEVKEALAKSKGNNIELEAINIQNEALDSLQFKEINSDKAFKITEDSLRYTFINYWATWCIPCVAELPGFEALLADNELDLQQIRFIFASNEDKSKIESFIDKKEIDLPFSYYPDSSKPRFIDHQTIPTSYLIDEQNDMMYKFSGAENWGAPFYKKILMQLQ